MTDIESLLRTASYSPVLFSQDSAWKGHLPFAFWLMQTLKPTLFVELGTHWGHSYFTFCQSVAENNLSTECYAVDTWQGEEHAGYYSDEVWHQVDGYNGRNYSSFSHLLRMCFDDALITFSDKSIDLLHIDGLHTYDAVKHDFETWRPKLAPGAVVLFHDTNVRDRDFGVWKLWAELQEIYPNNLEFEHSFGLGVLMVNGEASDKRLEWLQPSSLFKAVIKEYFSSLGLRQSERHEHQLMKQHVAEQDDEIAKLVQALVDREAYIDSILESRSWKLTKPLRSVSNRLRNLFNQT